MHRRPAAPTRPQVDHRVMLLGKAVAAVLRLRSCARTALHELDRPGVKAAGSTGELAGGNRSVAKRRHPCSAMPSQSHGHCKAPCPAFSHRHIRSALNLMLGRMIRQLVLLASAQLTARQLATASSTMGYITANRPTDHGNAPARSDASKTSKTAT